MKPRVLVSAPCEDVGQPALAALGDAGFAVHRCPGATALLESVMQDRPAAVIVSVSHPYGNGELQIFRLLRRVATDLPLVVISKGDSIPAERALRALDPAYLALAPVEPGELVEAVRGALARARLRLAPGS